MTLALVVLFKTHLVVVYPYEAVWPTVVRFLHVDRGWKVIEQDKEAGFIRFELVEDKKPHPATIELIRTSDEGRDAVRLQIKTADLAHYQEAPVLDAIARKLREELGPPQPPKKKEPQPAPKEPDAGVMIQ